MDEATKAFIEQLLAPISAALVEVNSKLDAATALVESVKEAQPERVDAVDTAGELAEAVVEAELGKGAVKRVLEGLKHGKTVADAVQEQKDIRDEVLAESKVRVVEGVFGAGDSADDDFTVSSVRFN